MVSVPDVAVGAVAAALIGGTMSLLGLIISKEQKTSEFRQAWIDALRSDLTAYLTQINAIQDAINVKYAGLADKVQTLRPLYIPLNTSTFNILLRVNPNENNSKRLLNAMEAFNALTADEKQLIRANSRPIETEFLTAAQLLLKSEWRRVKSGEWTFKIAKLLALIVILAATVGGSVAGYKMWWSEMLPPSQTTVEHSVPSASAGASAVPGSAAINTGKAAGNQ